MTRIETHLELISTRFSIRSFGTLLGRPMRLSKLSLMTAVVLMVSWPAVADDPLLVPPHADNVLPNNEDERRSYIFTGAACEHVYIARMKTNEGREEPPDFQKRGTIVIWLILLTDPNIVSHSAYWESYRAGQTYAAKELEERDSTNLITLCDQTAQTVNEAFIRLGIKTKSEAATPE